MRRYTEYRSLLTTAGILPQPVAVSRRQGGRVMDAGIRASEVNPAKLGVLYKRQLAMSRVAAGETVALVTDLATRRDYVAAAFAAADELGADIYELCVNSIPSWTRVGV